MRSFWMALVCCTSLGLAGTAFADDEDIGVVSQPICCGGSCCLIGGVCRNSGETNMLNPCQVCDPARSAAAWSDVADCDAGVAPTPDAGPPPDAAIRPGDEAGVPRIDGGTTPGVDAGTTPSIDGGTTPPPASGGCTVAAQGSTAPALLVLLGALALIRRRR